MKVNGSAVLHAPRERVWQAVTDPAVLAAVIPGCDELSPIEENRFALSVSLGVASIKGSYSGEVSFADLVHPESFTMRAAGSGGAGTIDTTVAVTLREHPDGTELEYQADAMVGGMVGGVGQRVLAGVAKKTAGMFFSAIDAQIAGRAPAAIGARATLPAATGVPWTAPAVPGGPAVSAMSPVAAGRSPAGALLVGVAAAVGAAAALVGVLVGVRIGRRG